MVNLVHCIGVVLLLLVCFQTGGVNAVSCKDRFGRDVDWWFIRKLPRSWKYFYIDAHEEYEYEKMYDNHNDLTVDFRNPLVHTINQLRPREGVLESDSPGVFYVFHNDDLRGRGSDLSGYTNNGIGSNFAHSKGIVAFQQDINADGDPEVTSGIQIIHSTPGFPVPKLGDYWDFILPSDPMDINNIEDELWTANNGQQKGQHYFCLSTDAIGIELAIDTLVRQNAFPYRSNSMEEDVHDLLVDYLNIGYVDRRANVFSKDCYDDDDCIHELDIASVADKQFAYSVNHEHGKLDLWAVAADSAQQSLLTHTFVDSKVALPTLYSPSGLYRVYSTNLAKNQPIKSLGIQFNRDEQGNPIWLTTPWGVSDDHAKLGTSIAISNAANMQKACVSGKNRAKSQPARGGDVVCFDQRETALLINRQFRRYRDPAANAVVYNARPVQSAKTVHYSYRDLANNNLVTVNLQDVNIDLRDNPEFSLAPATVVKTDNAGSFAVESYHTVNGLSFFMALFSRHVVVCECATRDTRCSASRAIRVPGVLNQGGNNIIDFDDKRIDVFLFINKLVEQNLNVFTAVQPSSVLSVCIMNPAEAQHKYDIVEEPRQDWERDANPAVEYRIILPPQDVRAHDYPNLPEHAWCYDDIARQFGRILISKYYTPAESSHPFTLDVQTEPGQAGINALTAALGLWSRFGEGRDIRPFTETAARVQGTMFMERCAIADVHNAVQVEVEQLVPTGDTLESRGETALAAFWDLLDIANDHAYGLDGFADANANAPITMTTIISLLRTYPFVNFGADPGHTGFFKKLLAGLPANQQQDSKDIMCYDRVLFAPDCVPPVAIAKRADYTQLKQALVNYGCDSTIVDSLSDETYAEIMKSIAEWTQNGDLSTNAALTRILERVNILLQYTDIFGLANLIYSPEETPISLRDNYEEEGYNPVILDPTQLIYYTRLSRVSVYRAAITLEFSEFKLHFVGYPYRVTKSNTISQGLVFATYHELICNFFEDGRDTFVTRTPSMSICQTAPIIDKVVPIVASAGQQLTITGYNFDSNSVIHIGDNYRCNIQSITDNIVLCTVGQGSGTNLPLYASSSVGTGSKEIWRFSYTAPHVASINTESGATAGGYTIELTGTGFGTEAVQLQSVQIGQNNCTSFTWISATSATCVVPPGAGAFLNVILVVSNTVSTTEAQFSYLAPHIDSISPSQGPTFGTTVIISGSNFGSSPSELVVFLAGDMCTIVSYSDNSITVTIPAIYASSNFVVETAGQESNEVLYSTFPPTITSLRSDFDTAGGNVIIHGQHFSQYFLIGWTIEVYFGDIIIPLGEDLENTDVQLLATYPAGVGKDIPLYVKVGEQSSATVMFSYDKPNPESLYWKNASTDGNALLGVIGENFVPIYVDADASSYIEVGGNPCTVESQDDWVDHTTVICHTPKGIGMDVPVCVWIGGQESTICLNYTYDAPHIESVQLDEETYKVTIVGINFIPQGVDSGSNSSIVINDVKCSNPTWIDSKKCSCELEAENRHPNNTLYVIIGGQQSNNATVNITGPQISRIDPPEGSTSGNYPITIHGKYFGNGSPKPVVKYEDEEVEVQWVSSKEVVILQAPKGIGRNKTIELTINEQSAKTSEFCYSKPTVSSISPTTTTTRGEVITLTGSNFVPQGVDPTDSEVKVDGASCDNPTWISDTKVSCSMKEGTGKDKEVVVTVGNQKSDTFKQSYTAPSITSLNPNHGPAEGGTQFSIQGDNFGSSISKITVHFGSSTLSGCTLSTAHTTLQCTSPAKNGNNAVNVKVEVDGQDSNLSQFTYDDSTTTTTTTTTTTATTSTTTASTSTSTTSTTSTTTGTTTSTSTSTASTTSSSTTGTEEDDGDSTDGGEATVTIGGSAAGGLGAVAAAAAGIAGAAAGAAGAAAAGALGALGAIGGAAAGFAASLASSGMASSGAAIAAIASSDGGVALGSLSGHVSAASSAIGGSASLSAAASAAGVGAATSATTAAASTSTSTSTSTTTTSTSTSTPSSTTTSTSTAAPTTTTSTSTTPTTTTSTSTSTTSTSTVTPTTTTTSTSTATPTTTTSTSTAKPTTASTATSTTGTSSTSSTAGTSTGTATSSTSGSFTTSTSGSTSTTGTTTGGTQPPVITNYTTELTNPVLPIQPVLCLSNPPRTSVIEVPVTIVPLPLKAPYPTPFVASVLNFWLECLGYPTFSSPGSGIIQDCQVKDCECSRWWWDSNKTMCRCPLHSSCLVPNVNRTLSFCSEVDYDALHVDVTSHYGNPEYTTPQQADNAAKAVYQKLAFVESATCKNSMLKNLICSTAFPRVMDGYARPVCRSIVQEVLACVPNELRQPETFNGTCVKETWRSCSAVDLLRAAALLPDAECTNTLDRAPMLFSATPTLTIGGQSVLVGGSFGNGSLPVKVRVNGTIIPSRWESEYSVYANISYGVGGPYSMAVAVGSQSSAPVPVFRYLEPYVTKLDPPTAPTGSNTSVVLIGVNFGPYNVPPKISLGSQVLINTWWLSDTFVVAVVPPGIGEHKVTVEVAGQLSSSDIMFSYLPPFITGASVVPAEGGVCTVTGTNFVPFGVSPGSNSFVVMLDVIYNVTWVDDTRFTFVVGPGTGYYEFYVFVAGMQSNAFILPYVQAATPTTPYFTVVTPQVLSTTVATRVIIIGGYFPNNVAVTMENVSPSFSNAAQACTIIGKNFGLILSDCPPGIGKVVLRVNADGTVFTLQNFMAYNVSVIDSVTPASPRPFDLVTLNGANMVPTIAAPNNPANFQWGSDSYVRLVLQNGTVVSIPIASKIGEIVKFVAPDIFVANGNLSVVIGGQVSNSISFTTSACTPLICLDVVFCVDSTNPTASALSTVKSLAPSFTDRLFKNAVDVSAAVAEYRDRKTTYGYTVKQAFSKSAYTASQTIQNIVSGGAPSGQTKEASLYGCLMGAMTSASGIGAWRSNSKKAIIILSTLPADDPEPVTGYTAASVTNYATQANISVYGFVLSTKSVNWAQLTKNTGGDVVLRSIGTIEDGMNKVVDIVAFNANLSLTIETASTAVLPGKDVTADFLISNSGGGTGLAVQINTTWPFPVAVVCTSTSNVQCLVKNTFVTITINDPLYYNSTIKVSVSGAPLCSAAAGTYSVQATALDKRKSSSGTASASKSFTLTQQYTYCDYRNRFAAVSTDKWLLQTNYHGVEDLDYDTAGVVQHSSSYPRPFLGPTNKLAVTHLWQFSGVDQFTYTIRTSSLTTATKCLDGNTDQVPQFNASYPAPFLWTCDTGTNQQWIFQRIRSTSDFLLINKRSGLALVGNYTGVPQKDTNHPAPYSDASYTNQNALWKICDKNALCSV